MKKKIGEWGLAATVAVFVFFLLGGLVVALEGHGYGSSEAAGWMQAIGSVGAIYIAFYVMRQQERFRRDESLTIARIAVTKMIPQFYALAVGLADVRTRLGTAEAGIDGRQNFTDSLNFLRQLQLWEVEELARLAPLPDAVAYKVTSVVGNIQMAVHAMTGVVGHPRMGFDHAFLKNQAIGNKVTLDIAAGHLNSVLIVAQAQSALLR